MYLAQVERGILRANRLCLVAQKLPNKTWVAVKPSPERLLALPRQYHHLAEGLLVMVQLNEAREIKSLNPALPEVLTVFYDWSMRVLKHNATQAQIREWRDSLNLQTLELNKVKQQLQNDRTAFELQKASYIAALESMRDRVSALQAQVDFLEKRD